MARQSGEGFGVPDGAGKIAPGRMQVHVAGTGLRGSGYPNAPGTLAILSGELGLTVVDRARWLPEGTTLWRKAGRPGRALFSLVGIFWLNLLEAIRVQPLSRRRDAIVYAPYPAIFLLWWLSWLPRSARPRVVADAYVSLWDAAFRDRGIASEAGWASKAFRHFEARALRAAERVHVDTIANRDWFIDVLGIEPDRVRAIPLALDAFTRELGDARAVEAGGHLPLKVLFIGTLVPLHGIGVIVDAARTLLERGANLEFTFVGDGQDREALASLAASPLGARVNWVRDWQSVGQVASHLRQADVCLGVFGGAGKASRVLPFKVYLALAAGKAVLTQRGMSLPQGVPEPPVLAIEGGAGELVAAIAGLASDRSRLGALSSQARHYYDQFLSRDRIAGEWDALLRALSESQGRA